MGLRGGVFGFGIYMDLQATIPIKVPHKARGRQEYIPFNNRASRPGGSGLWHALIIRTVDHKGGLFFVCVESMNLT